MVTRRDFSKFIAAGATALASGKGLTAAEPFASPAPPEGGEKWDLLIKGGTVIDPGQHLHALLDVAVNNGHVVEISKDIPESRAKQIFSAKGMIVTPGLIDLHVHCFDGFRGINADHYCLSKGVTTVIDAGSSGYVGIDGFVKYIVKPSVTRIYPLVNIAALGRMVSSKETFLDRMKNPDWVHPDLTAKAAETNKPFVVGIKALLQDVIVGAKDLECLTMALDAAKSSHLPLMAHIDEPVSPLPVLINKLRKGDVFSHFCYNHPHGVLDANGKLLPEVLDARARGVYFDAAHGQVLWSFDVLEKCMQQGFLPDTISSDLNEFTSLTRVFDLPTVMSKFLAIGMTLEQVIERVTVKPAQIFNYGLTLGVLQPGNAADIGIFEVREGKFEFEDCELKKRIGRQRLVNMAAVCRGQLFVNQALQ
jgi:dihydroorotase